MPMHAANDYDTQIRAAYSGEGDSIRALARATGLPAERFYRRAMELRLTRSRDDYGGEYCEAEREIVERHAGTTVKYIQEKLRNAGFHRSLASIRLHRARFHGDVDGIRAAKGLYAPGTIAAGFGVSVGAVDGWMRKGYLAYKEYPDGDGFIRLSTEKNLRDFIRGYLRSIPFNDANKYWIAQILLGGTK